jgi:hypothetical protein
MVQVQSIKLWVQTPEPPKKKKEEEEEMGRKHERRNMKLYGIRKRGKSGDWEVKSRIKLYQGLHME